MGDRRKEAEERSKTGGPPASGRGPSGEVTDAVKKELGVSGKDQVRDAEWLYQHREDEAQEEYEAVKKPRRMDGRGSVETSRSGGGNLEPAHPDYTADSA